MEVEIRSPMAGVCTAVAVKAGDIIDIDDGLVIISPSLAGESLTLES